MNTVLLQRVILTVLLLPTIFCSNHWQLNINNRKKVLKNQITAISPTAESVIRKKWSTNAGQSNRKPKPGTGEAKGYYQYARVPVFGSWEYGFRRGNPSHYKEQHEKSRGNQFRTKVQWVDKDGWFGGSWGLHYYDYNHVPKLDK